MKLKHAIGFILTAIVSSGCVTKIVNSDGSVQPVVIDKEKLSDTYVNLALEYQKHNAPQVALDRINLAVSTNTSNERAYMVRGIIYSQLNKPDAAEEDFKYAIKLKKDYPDAHVNYASFLCEQKRYDEAMTQFGVALNDPLYFTPEIGYYNRGKCYYQQKNYTAANADFMQSLTFKNPPPDSYIALARLQYEQKNYLVAKYYIDKYSASQTPESLWLHIQILQTILDTGSDPARTREYSSYRNTLQKVLIDDYGNSSEAQKCLLQYGQPKSQSAQSYNTNSSIKQQPNSSVLGGRNISYKSVNSPQSAVAKSSVVASSSFSDDDSQDTIVTDNSPQASINTNSIQTDSLGRRYIVMPSGVTVFSLAKKYNLTVKQLETYNKIKASKMRSGMNLYIDPVGVATKPTNSTQFTSSDTAQNNKPSVVTEPADVETPATSNSPVVTANSSPSSMSAASAVDSASVQTDSNGRRFMIVPAGATAFSISRKYGITVKQLEQYNGMKSAQVIKGMKLYIDPR